LGVCFSFELAVVLFDVVIAVFEDSLNNLIIRIRTSLSNILIFFNPVPFSVDSHEFEVGYEVVAGGFEVLLLSLNSPWPLIRQCI